MSDTLKHYILVAKPGIIFGNLVTAAGGSVLASRGSCDITVLLPALVGISLVVASGCVLNNCIDRDIDRKMARTCNRILVRGLLSVKAAGVYAFLLGIAGTTLLWANANSLSVVVVLAGFVIYVGVYSLYLKRHSVYGTLIGSLAGAAPPLAGYCAVGNRFDMGALILLSIFVLWQMPHCYAIAIFRFKEYAAASIPVPPVVHGIAAAKRQIVGYILAFWAASLIPTFAGYTGYSYLAVATGSGLGWLYMALSGYWTSDDRLWAKRLLVFSILNIFVLSVMLSVDATAPGISDKLLTYAP